MYLRFFWKKNTLIRACCSVSCIALSICSNSFIAYAKNKKPASIVWEAPCFHYEGYVDLQGKVGNKRSIGEASFFLPLGCSENELLFMDVRPKADTRDNLEGNVGIGFRQLQENQVVGVYGYFDRRRSGETGQYYSQMTVGAERLTENTEMRANVYVPLTGVQTVGGGSTAPYLTGTGIFIDRFGNTREEAPVGIDAEYGRTWKSFRDTSFDPAA